MQRDRERESSRKSQLREMENEMGKREEQRRRDGE